MPLGRWANRLVLLFALLLVLDSQWTISYLTEPIESVNEYKVYNKRGTVVGSYFRVKTPNVNFKLKTDLPPATTRIDVRRSALFKQARMVRPANNKDTAEWMEIESLYDGLLFLPILMGTVAAVGCWPPPGNRRIVDTAVMAVVMAVIHLLLLLRS
jgi:hypothetical protein